jgi:hypothetical protein
MPALGMEIKCNEFKKTPQMSLRYFEQIGGGLPNLLWLVTIFILLFESSAASHWDHATPFPEKKTCCIVLSVLKQMWKQKEAMHHAF